MVNEIDVNDLKRHRKAKKRKRLIKKLIIVLIVVLIGALIYYTRERWLPFFHGIASRYSISKSVDSEVEGGNFPLKISESSDYQVVELDNNFAVAVDTHFYVYSESGEELINKQHSLSNPIMRTNGRKALLYDIGGKEISLESKYKTVYTKKLDEPIVMARLGSNDYAAVVTKNDKVSSVLTIYDNSGDWIYKWPCAEGKIIDVTFVDDGCVITTLDAKGGQFSSSLHRVKFTEEKEVWKSTGLDTLAFQTYLRKDGNYVVFGDTKCAYYTRNGEFIGNYIYNSQLVGRDCSDSGTALVFSNEQRRRYDLVLFNGIKDKVKEIDLGSTYKQVEVGDAEVYVMTEHFIDTYSFEGKKIHSISLDDEYTSFKKIGGYVYLLGQTKIDRIDYN
ncbi:MAG: DUF5711 family protein [Oscillospiraceae bacterium]